MQTRSPLPEIVIWPSVAGYVAFRPERNDGRLGHGWTEEDALADLHALEAQRPN